VPDQARYLGLSDVMALHIRVMESLGYRPAPLRDAGRLESAIVRPQMAAFYEDADLVRQAALLAVGIAQAQAYVDGNKRTAYIATVVFLEWNGARVEADPLALARQLELVAERSDSLDAATRRFEDWLRQHVVT
jgi:death-on-curing protein